MKKFTFITMLLAAFTALTANATDKPFSIIPIDKQADWIIQDASNFEGTPGKEYYQAYNKKNGGRMLNYIFPESDWAKIDLANLPNNTYKWSMDLNCSNMAARSDMELVLLPVGVSSTDRRVSTHNYHWCTKNEGDDFFFRFRVTTAPTAANGEFGITINEEPEADNNWTVTGDDVKTATLKSQNTYRFEVEVNVESNVATYTITDLATSEVVSTGTHTYICDDRIGFQCFSMNGTSVHQLSNMQLSYFVDGVIAQNPVVDLFWVEGEERDYFAQFGEGEVLHWVQLGDAEDVVSGTTYTDGEEYTISYSDAMDTRAFETGEDCGRKIITCLKSGELKVWTSREDDETNVSDDVKITVDCSVIQLPAPVATITNVTTGYGKEYTLSVDNSEVTLKPTITIHYKLTQGGGTPEEGDLLSGEKLNFTGAGTLEVYSWDKTHTSEYYSRSETVTVENNVEYVEYLTKNYAITKAEAEGTMEGFTSEIMVDNANKSHWDRIYSDQKYGYPEVYEADKGEVYDGSKEYVAVKEGFAFYPGTAIGTDDAKWPVQHMNVDALATAASPLVITANDKSDGSWYLMPQEGLVCYTTAVNNAPVSIEAQYVSDDENKPNFYIIHKRGGYDRPDKADLNEIVVVKAGEDYPLYRYDTAICDVKVMTYKGFTPDPSAINGVVEKAQNSDNRIFNLAGQLVNGNVKGIMIKNGKKFIVK